MVPSQTPAAAIDQAPTTDTVNENGEATGNKRAKISLKVKRPSTEAPTAVPEPVDVKEPAPTVVIATPEPEVKVEDLRARALPKEVRSALATVIVE